MLILRRKAGLCSLRIFGFSQNRAFSSRKIEVINPFLNDLILSSKRLSNCISVPYNNFTGYNFNQGFSHSSTPKHWSIMCHLINMQSANAKCSKCGKSCEFSFVCVRKGGGGSLGEQQRYTHCGDRNTSPRANKFRSETPWLRAHVKSS